MKNQNSKFLICEEKIKIWIKNSIILFKDSNNELEKLTDKNFNLKKIFQIKNSITNKKKQRKNKNLTYSLNKRTKILKNIKKWICFLRN